MKIYIVGGDPYLDYINWIKGAVRASLIEEADLVLFPGGEDIHPSMYGERAGSYTHFNFDRDKRETYLFRRAKYLKIPCLGICRGAQLLCAQAGGRLVQHQQNEYFVHPIQNIEDKKYEITSDHHQAQFPYEMPEGEFKLLAWTEGLSKYHLDGHNEEMNPPQEVEIAYYPKINSLCIQGHPEWMNWEIYTKSLTYLNNLVKNLLNNSL